MKRDENGVLISNYTFLEKEYQDIDLYFVLAFARDEGTISEEDQKHLDEIIAKYDWAKEIEEARQKNLDGEIDDNEYMDIYTPMVMRLNDRIIEYNRRAKDVSRTDWDDLDSYISKIKEEINEEEPIEEEPVEETKEEVEEEPKIEIPILEVPKEEPVELDIDKLDINSLSNESKMFAEYLRLNKLIDKRRLTPAEARKFNDILISNDKAKVLELAKRFVESDKLSQEEYDILLNMYTKQLLEEATKVIDSEVVEESIDNISTKEASEFARYLRLSMLRDSNKLPKKGYEELLSIINNNEYASTMEKADTLVINGSLSKDEYDNLLSHFKTTLFRDAIKSEEKLIESKIKEEIEENEELEQGKREFYRYLELYDIFDTRKLTPEEQEELLALISNNEFAAEVERLRWDLEEHKISEEQFQRFVDYFVKLHEDMKTEPPKYEDEELDKLEEDILDYNNELDKLEEDILNSVSEIEKSNNKEEDELSKLEEDILNSGDKDINSENIRLKETEKPKDEYVPVKKDEYLEFIYDLFKEKDKELDADEKLKLMRYTLDEYKQAKEHEKNYKNGLARLGFNNIEELYDSIEIGDDNTKEEPKSKVK